MSSMSALQALSTPAKKNGRKTKLASNFSPGKYAVLCGRGSKCTKSPGNQRLKQLVHSYLKPYSEAKNKVEKTSIVSAIISSVKQLSPDGAFVKYEEGSWWEVEDNRKNKIVEVGNRQPLYRVEDDGIALIELAPTTHSGEAVLTFNYENNRQQEMRVWLSAEPREWILVGFAEGTAGYNTISDNQTAAFNAGMNV